MRPAVIAAALVLFALTALSVSARSNKESDNLEMASVEYANLSPVDPPVSFLLFRINSLPVELGSIGTQLPYEHDGDTLTLYLGDSKPDPALDTASVIYFRRGGQDNFAVVQFPAGSYFVGEAGSNLPYVHNAGEHTITLTLP